MNQKNKNGLILIYISFISLVIHYIISINNFLPSVFFILPHLLIIITGLWIDYRNYKSIASPLFIFAGIYFITIISSIILNVTPIKQELNFLELSNGSFVYLVFLIVTVLAYQFSFNINGKERQGHQFKIDIFNIKFYFFLTLIFGIISVCLHLYYLSQYSGFSLLNFITNPNIEYWLARQDGRNWVAIFLEVLAVLSVIIALFFGNSIPIKWKPSKIIIFFSILILITNALTSGNKTGFFWPFIGIIAIQGFFYKKLKGTRIIILSIVTFFILILAFMWRGAFNSISAAPGVLAEYNHLFYYTCRTTTEIVPNIKYFFTGISDLVVYLIPRIFWPQKPMELGLTRRYLDYLLIGPNLSMDRAFSTMGLSEAWMSGGYVGIIVSGLLMGLLLSWARKQILRPKSLARLIFAAYLYGSIYFIMRVGFLNVYIYNILFTLLYLIILDLTIRLLTSNNRFVINSVVFNR